MGIIVLRKGLCNMIQGSMGVWEYYSPPIPPYPHTHILPHSHTHTPSIISRHRLIPALLIWIFAYLASPLHAQISPVGTDNTFDIATWNIEWFGDANNGPSNDSLQQERVLSVIQDAGIDLWGVQEIADPSDFEALLQALGPDYDGDLATNSVQQRIGFIYDTRVVQVRQVRHILEGFQSEFASRPPLQLEADIVLPESTFTVTFIVVHMKAFSDQSSYERRVAASIRLKNHIDFTSLSSKKVIVLGDFNDELMQSTWASSTSPYNNFIADPDGYFFVSMPIEQSGAGSFCSNSSCSSTRSMLDHILISDELFESFIPESAGFIPNLPSTFSSYGATTSDHLPVYARFDFTRISGTNTENEQPLDGVSIASPYPNPFSRRTTLPITLDRPKEISIDVFDILGRRVRSLKNGIMPQGLHEISFDARELPKGVYFLRVVAEGKTWTLGLTITN